MRGPAITVDTIGFAHSQASANAIGEGAEIIKRGDAQAMVCGGAEATILPFGIAAFSVMKALSTRNDEPQRASRPFD